MSEIADEQSPQEIVQFLDDNELTKLAQDQGAELPSQWMQFSLQAKKMAVENLLSGGYTKLGFKILEPPSKTSNHQAMDVSNHWSLDRLSLKEASQVNIDGPTHFSLKIDVNSLVENEIWKLNSKVSLRPDAAIHVLAEATGLTDKKIDELFPNLRGFGGRVKLDISDTGNPPVVISIAETGGSPSEHIQLWYAYDVTNDRALDLIETMPEHPRTKIRKALGWVNQEAPLGDPEAAKKFLDRTA